MMPFNKRIAIVGLLLMLTTLSTVLSQSSDERFQKMKRVRQAAQQAYPRVDQLEFDNRTGPMFIEGRLSDNIDLADNKQITKFFAQSAEVFGVRPGTDDLLTVDITKDDELGMKHLRMQQFYKNLVVLGGELVLHTDASNSLTFINGKFIPDLDLVVTPSITSDQAIKIALDDLGPADHRWLKPDEENKFRERFKDNTLSYKPKPILLIAPLTEIRYDLPEASRVTVKIYDVLGREVAALMDGIQGASSQQVSWDAKAVASGLYFYRLDATSIADPARTFTQVRKMMVVK